MNHERICSEKIEPLFWIVVILVQRFIQVLPDQ